ncbi:TIGR03086 family metal-binding protein [Streptomyces sp. CA-249302]|uniref:TIGR03086 family metal-binding protein n=1 Tax=Streptomyces sp. CA-249302 TaxID=3240058 RepID=UPI003D8B292E
MDATDPRPIYARATEQTAALIKTVTPERLNGPTPCTEFDVRTLLGHIVGGTLRIAVVGEEGDGGDVRALVEGVADDGWPAAYEEVRARVLKAWESDERMVEAVKVPWGEAPGRVALSAYVMELVVHTWDLSEALGHPVELDPELAEFSLTMARQVLPEAVREGADLPFASALPAPEGADGYGQLAAWLGRAPLSPA